MSYLNQDLQEETCHEVETKKIAQLFLNEAKESNAQISFSMFRLPLQCTTLFSGTSRELRLSYHQSILPWPILGCTRYYCFFELSENQNCIPGNKCGCSVSAEEWGGRVKADQGGGTGRGSWNEVYVLRICLVWDSILCLTAAITGTPQVLPGRRQVGETDWRNETGKCLPYNHAWIYSFNIHARIFWNIGQIYEFFKKNIFVDILVKMLITQAKEMMSQRKAARASRRAELDAEVIYCYKDWWTQLVC